MPQVFRITYVRTSYLEVEFTADDHREAEILFEAAAANPSFAEQGHAVGRPQHRIVDMCVTSIQSGAPSPQKENSEIAHHVRVGH